MDILPSLAVVALAALIHASFQLSVSVLTLLSGRAMGEQRSRARVLQLTSSFVLGAAIITVLLLAFLAFVVLQVFGQHPPLMLWAVACGLMVGIGVSVWIFYYRRRGTTLWVPRGMARFLSQRIKLTKQSQEAFSLGVMSVLGELLFIVAPLFVSALVLVNLPSLWQLVGIGLYAVISLLTLASVWVIVGSGHRLSAIQRWRESNKHFLQFAAGSGLVVLGLFVYAYAIVGTA